MTNEELLQLFPIILTPHNPIWKENYLKEKYEHHRDCYTKAKTDFIKRIIKLARLEIENKY